MSTKAQRFTGGPPTATPRGGKAFTLLELIGVLAIVAILAAALVPNVIRQVDQAAWTKETADLKAMGEALELSIRNHKTVPDFTNLPAVIAREMALPVGGVSHTPRGYARAFLVDPNLRIDGAILPFTQTAAGAARPVSARLMFVSSYAGGLPVGSGIPTSAEFNAIWDAPENGVPSTWTSWAGKGDELRIRRLNLEPLFHRLVLVNRDANGAARYAIDSTNSIALLAGAASLDAWFLDGSVVGLHYSNGVVATKFLLDRDMSFVFEQGQWRGWIGPGDPYYSIADEFNLEAGLFLNAATSPRNRGGASQNGVLVAMYVFMMDYALWAEQCPRFSRHGLGGGTLTVPEYLILDSIGKNESGGILDSASEDLIAR